MKLFCSDEDVLPPASMPSRYQTIWLPAGKVYPDTVRFLVVPSAGTVFQLLAPLTFHFRLALCCA